MEWQVAAGLEDGEMIAERPDAAPNPAVEVRESLPDGTEFKSTCFNTKRDVAFEIPLKE